MIMFCGMEDRVYKFDNLSMASQLKLTELMNVKHLNSVMMTIEDVMAGCTPD